MEIDLQKREEVLKDRKPFLPEVHPSTDWTLRMKQPDGMMYTKGSSSVIISGSEEADGKRWIHVSLAKKGKMPEYQELKAVKNQFIGNKKAIMVFPEETEFVNIHKYCLHLWCCLDGDSLPDFTAGTGMI